MKHLWVGDISGRISGDYALDYFRRAGSRTGTVLGREADTGLPAEFFGPRRPFRGIVPRSVRQRGSKIAREGIGLFKRVFEGANGKPLRLATPSETRELAEAALDAATRNPQADDRITQLGIFIRGYHVIDEDAARALGDGLEGVLPDSAIFTNGDNASKTAFLEHLNWVGESTDGLGMGNYKFLTQGESVDSILSVYGASITDANRNAVRSFLARTRTDIRRSALDNFAVDEGVFRQLNNLHDNITDSFVTASRNVIQNKRYQQGIVARLMGNLSVLDRVPLITALDQAVTQKVARSYLVFGFYSVYNVLEAGGKMMLAGLNPFRRSNPYADNSLWFHGAEGVVPLEVSLPGSQFDLQLGHEVEGFDDLLFRDRPGLSATPGPGLGPALVDFASNLDPRNIGYEFMVARNQGQSMRHVGRLLFNAIAPGYNLGKRIVNSLYARYAGQMYAKMLRQAAPEVWDHAHTTTRRLASESGIDDLVQRGLLEQSIADDMERALFQAMMSGDAQVVRNVPKQIPLQNVPVGEIDRIAQSYPELPSIMASVTRQAGRDGRLYTPQGLNEFRQELNDIAYNHYMSSAATFSQNFDTMVDDLITTPALTAEEMRTKVRLLQESLDVYPGAVTNTIQTALTYADRIRSTARKEEFWNSVYIGQGSTSDIGIVPVFQSVQTQTTRVGQHLKNELRGRIAAATDPAERASLETHGLLLDRVLDSHATWSGVAGEDLRIRGRYFQAGGSGYVAPRQRNQQNFWGPAIGEIRANWNRGRAEVLQQRAGILSAMREISGETLPSLPDVSRSQAINTVDISKLFGVLTGDVDRSLYVTELRALKLKDEFVSDVLGQARAAAEQQGVDARGYGWTKERIEQIYDHLVLKFTNDPTTASALIPMQTQINSMLTDIATVGIRRGAMVNAQAEEVFQRTADNIAEDMSESVIEVINRGDPADIIPEVAETALALPSQVGISSAVTQAAVQSSGQPRQFNMLNQILTRFNARQTNSVAAAERMLDEVRLLQDGLVDVGTPLATGSIDSAATIIEREIANYNQVPRRISARVPVEEPDEAVRINIRAVRARIRRGDVTAEEGQGQIERFTAEGGRATVERTRTVSNPARAEIFANIRQQADRIQEAIQPYTGANATSVPLTDVAEEAVNQALSDLRRIPVRQVPEGTVQAFHGTGHTDFSNLRLVDRAQEVPVFRKENEPPFPVLFFAERQEASDFFAGRGTSFGRVFDADLQTENLAEVVGLSQDLVAADYTRIRGEGYDGIRFVNTTRRALDPDSQVIDEYIVWSDDAFTERGVMESAQYHDFSDPEVLSAGLQGLGEVDPERVFVGHGTPITEFSQNVAARQLLRNPERWSEVRANAIAEMNLQRVQDFPDYDNPSAIGSVLKTIYPFWGYEAHRWAWYLPREMIRHPGVGLGWGKYQNNTDSGYIGLPGPLDINPLRGTIAMGGMRRLITRDYPEYYDNFEGMSEFFDYGSRFGFYPGFPIGMLLSAFGPSAGGPQLGELVPPAARTLQGALAALLPDNPAVQLINETIFADRFRNYLVGQQVSRDSINATIGDYDLRELLAKQRAGTLDTNEAAALERAANSINGAEILRKQILEIPLTPEEEAAWARGVRGIGKWQPLMEQTGIFRFNPDERTAIREASYAVTEELTGVPRSILEDMRRYGFRWEDVWGARSPDHKQALNALELFGHFSTGIGLLPPQQRIAQANIQGFWQTVETNNGKFRSDLLLTEQEFEQGNVSFQTWDRERRRKAASLAGSIDELKAAPQFVNVPVTIQERLEFGEQTGLKIIFHPLEELRSLFYEIDLEETYDADLQDRVPNYQKYYLERLAVLSALRPDQREDFINFVNRNDTPLERLHFEVWQTHILPYRAASDAVLQGLSPEDQSIIGRANRAVGAERTELLTQTNQAGEPIVASFNAEVSAIRQSLRAVDPQLEGWLLFFGEIHQPTTPAGQIAFDEITSIIRQRGAQGLLREYVPQFAVPEATIPLTGEGSP